MILTECVTHHGRAEDLCTPCTALGSGTQRFTLLEVRQPLEVMGGSQPLINLHNQIMIILLHLRKTCDLHVICSTLMQFCVFNGTGPVEVRVLRETHHWD